MISLNIKFKIFEHNILEGTFFMVPSLDEEHILNNLTASTCNITNYTIATKLSL